MAIGSKQTSGCQTTRQGLAHAWNSEGAALNRSADAGDKDDTDRDEDHDGVLPLLFGMMPFDPPV